MKLPRPRFTVRRIMVSVAILGVFLAGVDAMRVLSLANKYRRKAEAAARMERNFREIDAMDPVSRARAAKEAEEKYEEILSSWLTADPVWTRSMIGYFTAMRTKYEQATENPRLPVPPDSPQP
jgi:hypothetical protein